MEVKFIRDLLHCHRLQIFNAFFEKIMLGGNDDVRNAFDGFLPLFQRFHKPVTVRDLCADIGTDVIRSGGIFQQFQIKF